MNIRKVLLIYGLAMTMLFLSVGCGNGNVDNTQENLETEETQETESEFYIEITDAAEILNKAWELYAEADRFDIMGGHFASSVMEMPAKYDLEQTIDLTQMYCVPEDQIAKLDDAATMIDLYNAGRFTAGAFHITDAEGVNTFCEEMKTQVVENEWHGEKPEKLLIVKVDENYVVTVFGRESLVNEFKQKLEAVYQEMIKTVVEEKDF